MQTSTGSAAISIEVSQTHTHNNNTNFKLLKAELGMTQLYHSGIYPKDSKSTHHKRNFYINVSYGTMNSS